MEGPSQSEPCSTCCVKFKSCFTNHWGIQCARAGCLVRKLSPNYAVRCAFGTCQIMRSKMPISQKFGQKKKGRHELKFFRQRHTKKGAVLVVFHFIHNYSLRRQLFSGSPVYKKHFSGKTRSFEL